jgi:hypothetical protein
MITLSCDITKIPVFINVLGSEQDSEKVYMLTQAEKKVLESIEKTG